MDSNPIAMLAKGRPTSSRALKVPCSIIDALPSPDLHGIGAQHIDEDEIRALSGVERTYSRIDWDSGEGKASMIEHGTLSARELVGLPLGQHRNRVAVHFTVAAFLIEAEQRSSHSLPKQAVAYADALIEALAAIAPNAPDPSPGFLNPCFIDSSQKRSLAG